MYIYQIAILTNQKQLLLLTSTILNAAFNVLVHGRRLMTPFP